MSPADSRRVFRFLGREVVPVLLPSIAFLVLRRGGGERGAFEGWLAACAVLATLAAFSAPSAVRALGRGVPALVLLVVSVVLTSGGNGTVAAWVLAGLFAAAYGLALAGRAVGAPAVSSAFVAVGVLLVAMSGFFWADRVASVLPPARRYAFRQAVVDADLSLASAYGVFGYDRMRDEDVYFRIPLASGLVRAPSAWTCGAIWLGLGVLGGTLGGGALRRGGKRGAAALDGVLAGREGGREPPERSAAPRAGV